jgi:drug/metabolite transporter (DMT)-like permease
MKKNLVFKPLIFIILSIVIGASVDAATKFYSIDLSLTNVTFSMELGLLVGSLFFLLKIKKSDFLIKRKPIFCLYVFLKIIVTILFIYILSVVNLFEFRVLFILSEIFLIFFGVFFLHEQFNQCKIIGTIFTIIGSIIIFSGEIPTNNLVQIFILYLILNALNIFLIKKIIAYNSKEVVFFIGTSATTIFYCLYGLFAGDFNFYAIIFIIGFVRAIPRWLSFAALEVGGLTFIAPLGYFEIIVSGVLGYIIFGTLPTVNAIIGAFIILAGIFSVIYGEKKISELSS